MKKFLKIMEKDITEDRFSKDEAFFYAGVMVMIGVFAIVMMTLTEWLFGC